MARGCAPSGPRNSTIASAAQTDCFYTASSRPRKEMHRLDPATGMAATPGRVGTQLPRRIKIPSHSGRISAHALRDPDGKAARSRKTSRIENLRSTAKKKCLVEPSHYGKRAPANHHDPHSTGTDLA